MREAVQEPAIARKRDFETPKLAVAATIAALVLGTHEKAEAQVTTKDSLPWKDPINWLVRRTTYGFNKQTYDEAHALGYDAWLQKQLNFEAIDDTLVESKVTQYFPKTKQNVYELFNDFSDEIYYQTAGEPIFRATYSNRQLFERVVEFWVDHFNVSTEKTPNYLQIPYSHNAIRANAMGKFRDLLRATAHSAAMMQYLDNDANYGGSPNQNYARELMELHTLGVDGGYKQSDVIEVARCLTGWSWLYDVDSSDRGQFRYYPEAHDGGKKRVLGHIIAGQGQDEGERVLDILAAHPSTAKFISKKLLRAFLTYSPSPALVNKIAAVFTATDGDIRLVLKAILSQENLKFASPKLKRPYHLVISAYRAINLNIVNFQSMLWPFYDMGMVPYGWGPPNGYPDASGFWGSSMLSRINFGLNLMHDLYQDNITDVSSFRNADWRIFYRNIATGIYGGELLQSDSDLLKTFLRKWMLSYDNHDKVAVGLALVTPSFQWY